MSAFLAKCPHCEYLIPISLPVKEGAKKECAKCRKPVKVKKLNLKTWEAELEKA